MPTATQEHIERVCQFIESTSAFCLEPTFRSLVAKLLADDVQQIRRRGIDQNQQSLWLILPVLACEVLADEPERLETAYPSPRPESWATWLPASSMPGRMRIPNRPYGRRHAPAKLSIWLWA